MTNNQHGLNHQQFQIIKFIFSKYSSIDEVLIFGSRAMNTFKEFSDLDLAIKAEDISYRIIAQLKSDFENSNLPYMVDIINLKTITSLELKQHLGQYGKVIYQKEQKKIEKN